METEQKSEQKTEEISQPTPAEKNESRLVNWLKNPYNLALVGIILAAFAIRLYFFFLTKSQPLWWDEAEYGLRAKAFAFSTPITGWAPERELIVPFIFSLFLKIGFGEIMLKFLQVLVSVATVFFTYFLLSKITSKRTGFVASFAMAFFWLHIFFTQRLLVYPWAPLLYLLIVYFFYEGYVKSNNKNTIIFAVISAIGLMTYFSIGFLLFGIFIYILLTEGISFAKNPKVWKVFIIFILALLPFMIYNQITFGFPIPRFAVGFTAATQESGAGLSGMLSYIDMFPSRVGWIFTILSFAGAGYFLFIFLLGFGIKDHVQKNSKWLLIFICFLVPLFLYTLYGVMGGSGTFYDAFILPVFPFFFAFAGFSFDKAEQMLLKQSKGIFTLLIILLLAIHAYSGMINSNATITAKITSYDSVKYAGQWIRENSQPEDIVISRSIPQNTYYSERTTIGYPKTEEELDQLISEKKPKFVIDSVWESTADWIHAYPAKHNDTFNVVQVYFLDAAKTQPSLVIYEPKYSLEVINSTI